MARVTLRSRSRSRSPPRPSNTHHNRRRLSRDRSRSPRRSHHHHSRRDNEPSHAPIKLPFKARNLSRHDLTTFRPMFALYLDVQKNILIEDLAEDEVKGRWKSFIGKWNDGKLAEGWYDPQTLEKAIASSNTSASANLEPTTNMRPGRSAVQAGRSKAGELPYASQNAAPDDNDNDDEEEEFGPALPQPSHEPSIITHSSKPGPAIPKLQDLQHARELAAEDALSSRRQAAKDLWADRKAEQAIRKSHLDEIAPSAEPGTRERQLEKRRELAASNRAFASAKTDSTDVELPDTDVIGGEDSLSELKRLKEIQERKRSEREIRREEVMRARKEEREERVREMRKKEEKTMEMLREIARARFGIGGTREGEGG